METTVLTSTDSTNVITTKLTPPQPKQAPPPPPPAPEDQTGGVGQTIDTFASYNPTALKNYFL